LYVFSAVIFCTDSQKVADELFALLPVLIFRLTSVVSADDPHFCIALPYQKGDPGVSISAYLGVLWLFGHGQRVDKLLASTKRQKRLGLGNYEIAKAGR
jgi:hypothetical protein